MAYQISHKASKAMLFHWITAAWQLRALADGTVTFADIVDEMTMLNMAELVHQQPILVYGTYKNACEFAKDFIGEQ